MNEVPVGGVTSSYQHNLISKKKRNFADSFSYQGHGEGQISQSGDEEGFVFIDGSRGTSTFANKERKSEGELKEDRFDSYFNNPSKLQKKTHVHARSFAPPDCENHENKSNWSNINPLTETGECSGIQNAELSGQQYPKDNGLTSSHGMGMVMGIGRGMGMEIEMNVDEDINLNEASKTTNNASNNIPTEAGSTRRQTNIYAYCSLNQSYGTGGAGVGPEAGSGGKIGSRGTVGVGYTSTSLFTSKGGGQHQRQEKGMGMVMGMVMEEDLRKTIHSTPVSMTDFSGELQCMGYLRQQGIDRNRKSTDMLTPCNSFDSACINPNDSVNVLSNNNSTGHDVQYNCSTDIDAQSSSNLNLDYFGGSSNRNSMDMEM